MRNGHALFLPISGLLGRAVSDLYSLCKANLQAEFPGLKVACVGTPFPKTPHPLLADPKHRARFPEEQVLRSWSRMIGFGIHTLLPALRNADIVISRRLGLDIILFAAASEAWEYNRVRALKIHHGMVRNVLVGEFGIRIPDAYIIPQAANGACARILLETFPELGELPTETLENFLNRQRKVIADDYFNDSTGQNRPFFVDAAKPPNEMFEDTVAFIRRQIELYR